MKKLFAALLALALALPASAGSTKDGRTLVATDHPNRFTCAFAGLAASLTKCVTNVTLPTGQRYYITDVAFQTTTATAGTFAIQSGTGTNCGTTTTAVWPVVNTAARWTAPISTSPSATATFATPIAVLAGH